MCVCVSEVSLSLNCDSMKFVGNNFLELYWDQIFSIKHYLCMYKGEYRVCVCVCVLKEKKGFEQSLI